MDASTYLPLFLSCVCILCAVKGIRFISSSDNHIQTQKEGFTIPLLISIVLVFWLGYRPLSRLFVDTLSYSHLYSIISFKAVDIDWHTDWIWNGLLVSCKKSGLSVHDFFAIIEAGYIFSALWAIKKLIPRKPLLGLLFVLSSMSFFSYGVNGIRNGLACHLFLLALSFLLDKKYIIGAIISLVSFGIHRSVMLPIVATLLSLFVIKKPKTAIVFWGISIVLSLFLGSYITDFFTSLGFDDRLAYYTKANVDLSQFSRQGFRWDFLLYSAVPILLTWYVTIRRGISDHKFNIIAITYILCNAFWVMIIQSSFSNRFAYLSWFLYPIVIAYPIANLSIWQKQDRKIGFILLAYCGFTLFMEVFYW